MFLPSLLEYSYENLSHKLYLINQFSARYRELSKNPDSLSFDLHLDFVLPQFAKDRAVMKSLSPAIVFDYLDRVFENKPLNLSVHLMGNTQDLFDVYKFFEHHKFNTNWNYLVFIPEKYTFSWENADFSEQNDNLKIGVWYDLEEWQNKSFGNSDDFLLMTVLAGKSGQKLTPEIAQATLKITNENPKKEFILDGGWSIETTNCPSNVQIVSHASFWSRFAEF
jgi:pentose-5-phosphate-3-epimerase